MDVLHTAPAEIDFLRSPRSDSRPLGRLLCDLGWIDAETLLDALRAQKRCGRPLGEILLARGKLSDTQLRDALAQQFGAPTVALGRHAPDPALSDALDPETCLAERLLPWGRRRDATLVATARPQDFARQSRALEARLGPVQMALVTERDIDAAIAARHGPELVRRAETRLPSDLSCRDWLEPKPARRIASLVLAATGGAAVLFAPGLFFSVLFFWALVTLLLATGMKAMAFAAQLLARRPAPRALAPPLPRRVPTITILVPLYDESRILPTLLRRLDALDYPREALEVLLIVEERDAATREALSRVLLPAHMRRIEVPHGSLRTKPRAMNYALGFARGEIVGIYDAEDAPEPDQLRRVAARFATRPPDVVCLQGALDYYNPHSTWIARCFTIEYATWFRMVLPGLARLGLAIPLGGTTLFFRRDALEALGGWDTHNVTEDCDLGIRLARRGWRTEMLDTVTREEASNRVVPWVRQRSRWLKGFMLTYAVHMRRPRTLLRELGPRQFWGVQLLLVTATTQFLMAPLLWSFWLVPLGLVHPLEATIGSETLTRAGTVFLASEAVALTVAVAAVGVTSHRGLRRWTPTMHLYFPLGAFAAYKALFELAGRPFYWDKTTHGHSLPEPPEAPEAPSHPPPGREG
ncbi:glycosyltransferase family 2 protein [Rhodosalinus sp. 5P4]|uniref:glycosyltransferase family 2 protein n=1 Tax=Rhodosalinus sp. 5P4 TaxID=3239196 RepID=UPI003523A489